VAGAAVAALLVKLALAAGASANPPSEIVIPAGYVATLSNAAFGFDSVCGSDRLNYGYELNSGPNVQVGPTGVGCEPAAGATIGPFSANTQLRIYIDDFTCAPPPQVFYSDGLHALVTPVNALTWGVSLMDSDLCTSGPTVPRVPGGPGQGNFNVTVTLTPLLTHLKAWPQVIMFGPGVGIGEHLVRATLTDNSGHGVGGQTIVFTTHSLVRGQLPVFLCTAVTNSQGVATCPVSEASEFYVLDTGYTASFAATGGYLASTGSTQAVVPYG